MLVYDESFVAVMTATREEATALGARAYGSEHVLLGLLVADGDLTQQVVRSFPQLSAAAVRGAVHGAADDAPHLARLGLDAHVPTATGSPAATEDGGRAAGGPGPRNKHTPEMQSAMNAASAKWGHLRDTTLPKEPKVSSAVLWLAVLEPSARAARLLHAMEIDPDDVRTAVLSALVPDGAPVPAWPEVAPVGPVSRLVRRVLGRTNVAR